MREALSEAIFVAGVLTFSVIVASTVSILLWRLVNCIIRRTIRKTKDKAWEKGYKLGRKMGVSMERADVAGRQFDCSRELLGVYSKGLEDGKELQAIRTKTSYDKAYRDGFEDCVKYSRKRN